MHVQLLVRNVRSNIQVSPSSSSKDTHSCCVSWKSTSSVATESSFSLRIRTAVDVEASRDRRLSTR